MLTLALGIRLTGEMIEGPLLTAQRLPGDVRPGKRMVASGELPERRTEPDVAGPGLPVHGLCNYGESMAVGKSGMDGQLHELVAQAQAARRQSQVLAGQHRALQHDMAEVLQRIQAARNRAEQVHELWLAVHSDAELLRYSAYARLQARLASMPVIEQAKGIIMAQYGWPEDQAFDALRRASQRENIRVRDLAAKIVAKTAQSASAQSHARDRRQLGVRHG